jgi:DNA-binding NtrC family response regulator
VRKKQFREDLFHRLNSFNIPIPPLRNRPEDIVALADHYLEKYNRAFNLSRRLSPGAVRRLQTHGLRGNVRELKNLLKNAMVVSDSDTLDLFPSPAAPLRNIHNPIGLGTGEDLNSRPSLTQQLEAHEKMILEQAARRCRSTRQMAEYLGTNQSKIVRRLRKYDLTDSMRNRNALQGERKGRST